MKAHDLIDQEPDRVPSGLVRRSALIVAIMIVASIIAAVLLGRGSLMEALRSHGKPPARVEEVPFQLPSPNEEARRAAQKWLGSYGWVDRAHGVIHVPIEVATDLYLSEAKP